MNSTREKHITIAIIGDSWGVPSYPPTDYVNSVIEKIKKSSQPNIEINVTHLGDPPETHLEFLLRDAGYKVINFSKNGGSNLTTIRLAKKYCLENNIAVDWVIWFHTESLRDKTEILKSNKTKFSINTLTKDLAVLAYREFADLINTLDCKTIVVGGQAPVLVEQFIDIVKMPELLLADWHSDILGIKLPFSHGICNLDVIESESCIDSLKEKSKMLDDIDTILKLDFESSDFPDNAHPGQRAHKELFDKIHYTIKESK
jgi:hypothetical protein